MTKFLAFTSLLSFLSLSCTPAVYAEKATAENSVPVEGKLTEQQVKNAIYRLSPWEADSPDTFVKLTNGEWKKGEESVAATNVALGDLNKDGTTDAAAVYYTSGGGSGLFFNVTAFVNKDGRLMAVDNKVLGDRTRVSGLTIKNGVITVTVTTWQTGLKKTGKYTLKGNKLVGPDTLVE